MPNIDDVYASKWLRASDIGDRPVKATVDSVGETTFKDKQTQQEKRQIVLNFREFDKPFGCNKTNATNIAKILNSRNTDNWVGKTIVLFVAQVDSFGETVEAIRVRAMKAQAAAEPPRRQPIMVEEFEESENPGDGLDDDIPF